MFVVAFISIFKGVFGNENTLIGVTVITATLMLLERDLTISVGKNLIFLAIVNLTMGIMAFAAAQNIYLGVVLNFTALFLIAYLFSYDLRKPTYIAFGLQYLFMVTSPVDIEHFPMRLLALLSGAIFIMVVQVIANKNKFKNTSEKNLCLICDELLNKINLIKQGEKTKELDEKIDDLSKEIKLLIYDNRKNNFYITNRGICVINMIFSLERISLVLDRYKNDYKEVLDGNITRIHDYDLNYKDNSLDSIYICIEEIKSCIKNINQGKAGKDAKNKEVDDINLYEVYNLVDNLHDCLNDYRNDSREFNKEHKLDIPLEYKTLEVHKRNFNIKSLRFSYAIKIALATAISGFILAYLKVNEARWVMFTVFALVKPYTENTEERTKKRITGTIIGCIFITIAFNLIKEPSLRGMIIVLTGYLNGYAEDYRNIVICATLSAIGSSAMSGNAATDLALARILYVSIGIVISMAVNKFILPYNAKIGYKYILDMYSDVARKMIREVDENIKGKQNNQNIKNLVLISVLIEDKLFTINKTYKDESQDEFIANQRLLMSNIYDLYINIRLNKVKDKDIRDLIEVDDYVKNCNTSRYEVAKNTILKIIYNTKDLDIKIVCINLLEIVIGIHSMNDNRENINIVAQAKAV